MTFTISQLAREHLVELAYGRRLSMSQLLQTLVHAAHAEDRILNAKRRKQNRR